MSDQNPTHQTYQYPINDGTRKHYVRYPVQVDNDKIALHGMAFVKPYQWVTANVLLDGGYTFLGSAAKGFDTEEECQKACDKHNDFFRWSPEQVQNIISVSMQASKIKATAKKQAPAPDPSDN